MTKSRASKGLLRPPQLLPNPSAQARLDWLKKAEEGLVAPGAANKKIFVRILELLWPANHGLPGPHVTEKDIRSDINSVRTLEGKEPYQDVFRRMRELQGEEGFTSIIKEGTKYQLQGTEVAVKREPRQRPSPKLWAKIKQDANNRCAHCGAQEPNVKLSPDHRMPRSRGGTNDDGNWQPLCEQCNNAKSSACQGCTLNCQVCSWSFPETYKPVVVDDNNRELLRREAERAGVHQSELANKILREHFNKGH